MSRILEYHWSRHALRAGSEAREKGRRWENIINGMASIFAGMVGAEISWNTGPVGQVR